MTFQTQMERMTFKFIGKKMMKEMGKMQKAMTRKGVMPNMRLGR